MHTIGAREARTQLPRLLDRVARGESLTITRHDGPVARLVPVEDEARDRAQQAARRIRERRARLGRTSIAELIATIHDRRRMTSGA